MEKSLLHDRKKRPLLQIAAAGVILFTGLLHAASMIGGESGAYLRYPAGAAAMAMGGAYSAAPDAMLSWWNPALLCLRDKRTAAFGGGMRPLGQTEAFSALEFRVPPRMGMGLFLLYRGDPFLNNLHDENENEYNGTSYTTITAKIALSYYVNRRLSAGATIAIRYVRLPTGFSNGKILTTSELAMGSVDFSVAYKWSSHLRLTAQIKNIGATMNWDFSSLYDYYVPGEDNIPPSLVLAGSYQTTLLDKPLIWNTDMHMYAFDASMQRSIRAHLSFSTGAEWQYWEKLHVRMGIGDLPFNGELISNGSYYWRTFAFRLAGGCSYDLAKIRQGMRVNYACSTDKVWAGVDQMVDITLQF